MTDVPLGPHQLYATMTCGRAVGSGWDMCGAPATHHLLFVWDPAECGAACPVHAEEMRGRAVAIHEWGGVCNMPGTSWLREQNRCAFLTESGHLVEHDEALVDA